jgi:hypothetical protein
VGPQQLQSSLGGVGPIGSKLVVVLLAHPDESAIPAASANNDPSLE